MARFSIRNPHFIFVLCAIVAVVGVTSGARMITLKGSGMTEAQLRDIGQFAIRNQLARVAGASVPQPFGGKFRQMMVVSNSILIVEFTHRLQGDGMGLLDAVVNPCRIRLRPILMTSLATILGLVPMALKLGTGSEAYAPRARAIIGGRRSRNG
jgi:multidrug efflux pump subunit AcrB